MERLLLAILFSTVFVSTSAAECTCRGKNVVAAEGEIVCLTTPTGQRLALCEKVLNNTSWKFLPGNCSVEVTDLTEPADADALTDKLSSPTPRFVAVPLAGE